MARGTRATGDYDEAHSAPLAANAEDAEEIQAVPVTKRVVSLRFPDLPHDALSNEHGNNAASIEGRLLDNDPRLPFWGWVFRRGKPGSRGQKNTANAIPQGLSSDEQGRRIPFNSVIEDRVRPWLIVRFLCCCCLLTPGWDWKKAYWISAFNLICAIAHGTMTYLCLSAAWGKGEKFEIPIHRIRADWESGAADGYNFTVTTDEMLPIRFDWLTASFFGLSFFFHLAAFLAGWFDRYIQYYWRQLDLCFAWWRWLEYTASASLMMMALGIVTGIRHGGTLAALFMFTAVTMVCGLLTELYSRPARTTDGQYDFRRWEGDPVYEQEQALYDVNGNQVMVIRSSSTGRFRNYMRRMIPHIFGIFPYLTAWSFIFDNFGRSLHDLYREDPDLFDLIPWWVPIAIGSTFAIFSTFGITQIYYQWQPPKLYWKTEAWYAFLSLTSKMLLGGLLYSNVLRMESFDSAIALNR